MKYKTYNLREIANFNLYGSEVNSPIKLPEIQRGLVWKSRQVELLWDSILSEYPIGSFMVVNGELYDGQQRISAITAGFDYSALFGEDKPESILWLDLGFKEEESLSRRYGFRLTTKAHPWGYRVNDGAVFSTNERKSMLGLVYGDGWESKSKEEWDIRNFKPKGSIMPVPFAIMLNAIYSEGDFVKNVIDDYRCFINRYLNINIVSWSEEFENEVKKCCNKLYGAILKIKEYEVLANIIEPNMADKKYLELFFYRINTGGTRITQDELAYSAIKLYWQDSEYGCIDSKKLSFAAVNRDISKEYMSEAELAQIVFRSMCSENSVKGPIDAAFIRKLKAQNQTIVDKIDALYKENGKLLRVIMQRLSDNFCGIPKYVQVEIVRESPVLYILLFIIAKLQCEKCNINLSKEYVRALTLYLYCCCRRDRKDRPVHYIFYKISNCISSNLPISEKDINEWIANCISFDWSNYVISDAGEFKAFNMDMISEKWNIWDYQYERGGRLICELFSYGNNFHQLAMLKVVERDSFKRFFNDYNPVRQDLWEDENRPWDDDHIIPQSWVAYSQSPWREVCKKWIWSIGNFAHIPFEKNRSKNSKDDWSFYLEGENGKELHFDESVKCLGKDFVGNEEAVKDFIGITRTRFCNIYGDFVKMLAPLKIGGELSKEHIARRDIMLRFKEYQKSEYRLYYVSGERDLEFAPEDNYGWIQPWVSIAKSNVDGTMDSLTIGFPKESIDSAVCVVEFGIRKNPGKSLSETDNHGWWHKNKVKTKYFEISDLKEEQIREFFQPLP